MRLDKRLDRFWLFAAGAIVAGSAARLGQLRHTLDEMHGFRQTQTSLVVREYVEHGISLLHTPLPVFGRGSDVPMELPLVQGVAALVAHLGVSAEAATRLVGLAGFQATALLLFLLVGRWHGYRAAAIAIALFESLPLGLAWGASALIEFPATAVALTMVLALDRWFEKGGSRWLMVGVAAAWVAFLVKSTTAPPWVVLVIASGLVRMRAGVPGATRRVVVGGLAGPVAGLACALAWTRYADSVKSGQPLTGFLTSSALTDWNFGTLAQRLDPANGGIILNRVVSESAGLFALVGLVWCLLRPREGQSRVHLLGWAGVAASAPLVFFNLYFVHNYYLSAIYPAVVVLAALAIDRAAAVVAQPSFAAAIAVVLTVTVVAIGATTKLGRADVHQWRTSGPLSAAAVAIKSQTPRHAAIVMIGCDWNPQIPYEAHRDALMFRDESDDGYWDRMHNLSDYRFLFSCNPELDPSPYLPTCAHLRPTPVASLWKIEHPVTPCP
jgi:hypothetical protein